MTAEPEPEPELPRLEARLDLADGSKLYLATSGEQSVAMALRYLSAQAERTSRPTATQRDA